MDLNFGVRPTQQPRLVYIRKLAFDELPADLQQDANVPDQMFAILSDTGEQIALLDAREAAFDLARANALVPLSVH